MYFTMDTTALVFLFSASTLALHSISAHSADEIRKDIEERGDLWRQSPYISFCNSNRYRQTEESCYDLDLLYDSGKCKCIDDPREKPVRPIMQAYARSFALSAPPQPRCMYDYATRKANVDAFTEDAAKLKNHLHEFECGVQIGPLIIPQPSAAHLHRKPEAVYGLTCVGLPDRHGRQCVAEKTFQQQISVDEINENNGDVIDATLEVALPLSCYMAKVAEDPCTKDGNKYRDAAGVCKCKNVQECTSAQEWLEASCMCIAKSTSKPEIRPRSPRDVTDEYTTLEETTLTTEAPSTDYETMTPSPVFHQPSTISLELACLRTGGCSLGFGRIFDRATLKCSCSCMVENLLPKFICKGIMKNTKIAKNWVKEQINNAVVQFDK